MDGFFVTINCSKILDSEETFYKIFIDKSKLSIVYELIQWIRFMFSLEKCFFLIHDNSVIHELEDIKVLEILKTLEIRPCLRTNCIHSKMEKTLFRELNLFVHWKELKVHELLQARCKFDVQIIHNQQNRLNINENSNNSSLEHQQNFFAETHQSKLRNTQHAVTFPSKETHNVEDDKTQIIEIDKQDVSQENQLNCTKSNSSVNDNSLNIEMKNPGNFFSHNLKSTPLSNSNELNSFTENSSSFINEKEKIQSKPKKFSSDRKNQRKMGIPFALGAFLSDIRQKAQNQEFKEKKEIDQMEKLFTKVQSSPVSEYSEGKNSNLESTSVSFNESSQKRKRKRKHKKRNSTVDLNEIQTNLSWDYSEPSAKIKPNHIRFSDTDEAIMTDTIENLSRSCDNTPRDINPLEVIDAETQSKLTAESTPSVEYKNNKACSLIVEAQVETSENLTDQYSNGLNCVIEVDSNIEKQQPDNCHQNLSDLQLLKQKITHPRICTRFF